MRKVGVALFVISLLLGCKDKHEVIIPNVQFSGTLYMNNPNYMVSPFLVSNDLVGNRLGTYGVVVFSQNSEIYYVYDIMCPFEKSSEGLIMKPIAGNSIVTCKKCGSQYELSGGYGSVIKGPSHYSLKVYQNRYDSADFTLSIWN